MISCLNIIIINFKWRVAQRQFVCRNIIYETP